jgi:hypothetical protein
LWNAPSYAADVLTCGPLQQRTVQLWNWKIEIVSDSNSPLEKLHVHKYLKFIHHYVHIFIHTVKLFLRPCAFTSKRFQLRVHRTQDDGYTVEA